MNQTILITGLAIGVYYLYKKNQKNNEKPQIILPEIPYEHPYEQKTAISPIEKTEKTVINHFSPTKPTNHIESLFPKQHTENHRPMYGFLPMPGPEELIALV